jgi:hypothetical protein
MIVWSLFISLAVLCQIASAAFSYQEYKCTICISTFEQLEHHTTSTVAFQQTCEKIFPAEVCANFKIPQLYDIYSKSLSPRDHCQNLNFCPQKDYVAASSDIDIRVARAMGSKGYDKIRLSVISNTSIPSQYFTYSDRFKYRWTDKFLSTGIVSVTPGEKTSFNVGGKNVEVYLPKENEGVRGFIIADPCFTSEWVTCKYQDQYNTFNHVTELLNTLTNKDDISFWQILGDNFYDLAGQATSTWFAALSDETKSKFLYSTPGNHDFWVGSSPSYAVPTDQYGNGMMQFYAQDTIASTDSSPYDFSVNPDDSSLNVMKNENIPNPSNYFFYNKLGNLAFIGFSGAHTYESMIPFFNEACTWANNENPLAILLVGHWNIVGCGGPSSGTVPNIYDEISGLDACKPVMSKIKYFMGHKHCNLMTKENVGYMVGGAGMSDAQCHGDFGFTIVDSLDDTVNVYHFPIAHESDFDNYDTIVNCLKENGVAGCYHLAQKWT